MFILICLLFIVVCVLSAIFYYLLKQLDKEVEELYDLYFQISSIDLKKNDKGKVVKLC